MHAGHAIRHHRPYMNEEDTSDDEDDVICDIAASTAVAFDDSHSDPSSFNLRDRMSFDEHVHFLVAEGRFLAGFQNIPMFHLSNS
jgi:hypothetical protein